MRGWLAYILSLLCSCGSIVIRRGLDGLVVQFFKADHAMKRGLFLAQDRDAIHSLCCSSHMRLAHVQLTYLVLCCKRLRMLLSAVEEQQTAKGCQDRVG